MTVGARTGAKGIIIAVVAVLSSGMVATVAGNGLQAGCTSMR